MNWTILILGLCVVVAFILLKRASFVSADNAETFLREGAVVVDVRSPSEFSSGHLPGALNIPLGSLSADLPKRIPEKTRVLLLHCASGARSGMAQRQAAALGYKAYNLGTYGRAESIVTKARKQ